MEPPVLRGSHHKRFNLQVNTRVAFPKTDRSGLSSSTAPTYPNDWITNCLSEVSGQILGFIAALAPSAIFGRRAVQRRRRATRPLRLCDSACGTCCSFAARGILRPLHRRVSQLQAALEGFQDEVCETELTTNLLGNCCYTKRSSTSRLHFTSVFGTISILTHTHTHTHPVNPG